MSFARIAVTVLMLAASSAALAVASDASAAARRDDESGVTQVGPDVSFCQLYDLRQFGRVDDVVGLAVATTAWNVGDEPVDWLAYPSPFHPLIVMNLYRLKDGRFEQIGQSWIKHTFCALDNAQCGGTCVPSGCNSLNPNCTETHSSSLNATQGGFGPRYEVNPWTGEWDPATSHMGEGPHVHDPIEHRLQVDDDDFDPTVNEGAAYFVEAFYCAYDDVDAMNSASWKPVAPVGEPGGVWTFQMTDNLDPPNIGWALDAWVGATQALIAQELPLVEFVSPDGRCILGAKVTDRGGGLWHYEYALLNVDMDRQVGSFSVPINSGAIITGLEFHAPLHHEEPVNTAAPDAVAIDNTPWTVEVTPDAVTWHSDTNPLRWGTLYNFRFDADRPPSNGAVSVGLFRPGVPGQLFASSVVPGAPPYDLCEGRMLVPCNASTVVDNTSATTAPDDPFGSCWIVADGYGGIGTVFLEFIAETESVRIRTDTVIIPPAENSEFTVFQVNQGDVCDKRVWVQVGCSEDDGAGPGAFNGDIAVDGLNPGNIYIVEVAAFAEETRGIYTVETTCPGEGAIVDCNGNGTVDSEDIATGTSADCNASDIPDECEPDNDRDGVVDACDNCVGVANSGQEDSDGDGFGDACDNCPEDWNPGQEDGNGNGVGDACACHSDAECDDDDVCSWDSCNDELCYHEPNIYGDVNHNEVRDLFDVFCILDLIAGDPVGPECAAVNADIEPCEGNETLNVFDLFAVLGAIAGTDPCCSPPP